MGNGEVITKYLSIVSLAIIVAYKKISIEVTGEL